MKGNESEKAKRLYEMGKEMCELAKSMGYSEEEGEDEMDDEEGEGDKKMETALALFGGL